MPPRDALGVTSRRMTMRPTKPVCPQTVGRSRSVRTAVMLYLPCLALLSGCGSGGPIAARLDARVVRPQPGVVLLICDGLAPRAVEQGCREGWLPNFQKRFMAGGANVEHATTCIPPITYGAVATLLTGVGPGQHTVIGNRWFDPDRAFFRTYITVEDYRDVNTDCVRPTIYEMIKPATSVSIQTAHTRGVTHDIPNWATSGVTWLFGDYTAVDKRTASTLPEVVAWANAHRQWPALLTCYFPGADTIGHRHGISSPDYQQAVINLDHQVGRICDWLESQGLLETTYVVVVSDHGLIDVTPDGWIDLARLVRDEWGRNATYRTLQEGPRAWRKAYFDRFDTVVAYQNGRGAFLYFRGPSGWGSPPDPEEVESILTTPPPEAQLWNIPGVAVVTYLGSDEEAVVRSERGESRIRALEGADGPEYAYLPQSGDVLGYMEDPNLAAFVRAGYHDARAWLNATARQTLPDIVPHLVSLLRVHRAGQVVVFTKPGYSFVHEQAGHGGIHKDELLMTFMLAGPGIAPRSRLDVASSADLTPTLLDLLGRDPNEQAGLEGISLLKAGLLSAGTKHAEQ